MNRRLKRPLLSLVSLLLCLAIVEAMLTVHSRAKLGPGHRRLRVEERRAFVASKGMAFADPRRAWENSLRLHPLFGYTLNPKLDGVNNYGFTCPHNFLLDADGYHLEGAPTNALIVGFFGGSFAGITADQTHEYVCDRLQGIYPDRTPVVVNLAIGGHAIPQSVFIFLYFRGMIDIAVFIDGVNEPWNYLNNNLAGSPPEYAKATHYDYKTSLSALTPERFELTECIVRSRKRLRGVTEAALLPGIRNLMITQYAWVALATRFEHDVAEAMHAIKRTYLESKDRFHELTDTEVIRISALQWARYHELVHSVSSDEGILDIHVLQPSPYVPEAHVAAVPGEGIILERDRTTTRLAVPVAYPIMRERLHRLRDSGAATLDLSCLAVEEDDNIWTDPWHLSPRGGMQVADAICDCISERHSPRD